MGTNFYIRRKGTHIGKRSAAGWYCWDCGVTLRAGGAERVHCTPRISELDELRRQSALPNPIDERGWFKNCPKCNKPRPELASLSKGAVARELGFDKSPFAPRQGIDTCSSFSWAIDPEGDLYKSLLQRKFKPIVNEYGDLFTVEEWLAMLEECPLRYTHSIGMVFS